jgi:diguanylate cyclase (GGDEF)-like protein
MTGIDRQYQDDLSGAFNRRYLSEVLEPEIRTLMDRRACFSLVMVDIDRFKEINDLFGHLRGDQVIREFAAFLRSCIRPGDRVVRYGGDEFLCYMQGIGRDDSERIYQRILERCRFRKMAGHSVTISVGIAEHPRDASGVAELIKIADESLYDAKRRGRDRLGAVRTRHLEVPIKAFVNRSREKELLSLCLMAAEGRAKVVLVKGAVGIGKTRLVREVLNRISYREVLWADCLALDEAISYYCIRQLLSYKLRRRKLRPGDHRGDHRVQPRACRRAAGGDSPERAGRGGAGPVDVPRGDLPAGHLPEVGPGGRRPGGAPAGGRDTGEEAPGERGRHH